MPVTTNHTAWHSTVFMLAFDLVVNADHPDARSRAFAFVRSRLFGTGSEAAKCDTPPSAHPQGKWPSPDQGMPGNVYSAFFALEALYNNESDRGGAALSLLLSNRTNTWLGQLASGATTTKEAW